MKKNILLAAAFGLLIVAGTAQADSITGSHNAAAGDGIVNSKHDLSTATGIGMLYGGQNDSLDRICIYCHAPHHTMQESEAWGIKYLPLWNHEVTHLNYDTYQSDFGDGPAASGAAGVGEISNDDQYLDRHLFNGDNTLGDPGSVSRLCLSCHDGSVAINQYGSLQQRDNSQGPGGTFDGAPTGSGAFISSQFEIGGSGILTNHHPIGFSYIDVATVDDEIADPDTQFLGDTGEAREEPGKTDTSIRSLLYNGEMMECVTCHDVHNTKNTGETFLWISDRESKFCLTCHIK